MGMRDQTLIERRNHAMGKPIGDGHPLAAVMATAAVASLAVLDAIEQETIQQNVQETGPNGNVLKIRRSLIFSKSNADGLLATLNQLLDSIVRQIQSVMPSFCP